MESSFPDVRGGRAQAASRATLGWRSPSRSTRVATTSGPPRARLHASARIAGSAWRSNGRTMSAGKRERSPAAAATACVRVGPCTQPRLMMRATEAAASGPPMPASASNAARCSGRGVRKAEAGEAAAIGLEDRDGGGDAAAAGFPCEGRTVREAGCRDRGQQRGIVECGRGWGEETRRGWRLPGR